MQAQKTEGLISLALEMIEIQHQTSLQALNTFGIDVHAAHLAHVRNESDLQDFFSHASLAELPRLVLGGGSNVLFTQDFPGVVLLIGLQGRKIVRESDDDLVLEVAAGENWHALVLHAVAQGWGGIENLSLIPGKVGAAPIQNIGAYGVELRDRFEYLDFFHFESRSTERFYAADCQFGYRDSVFKRELKGQGIILRVALRLSRRNHTLNTSYGAIEKELDTRGIASPTLRDISEVVIAIRQSKLPDPAQIGNSGSFFKNPELPTAQFEALKREFPDLPGYVISDAVTKVPAAWLIDRAGWKGQTFGNYGVHKNQALVLVNYGGARGRDIYDLSGRILESVREKYGVELEREVNVI